MSRYRLDEDAQSDLRKIHRYIAQQDPKAARRMVRSIRQRFRLLAERPLLGESVDELVVGARRFTVGSYVIYYRPRPALVEILRVLHGAQDAEAQF